MGTLFYHCVSKSSQECRVSKPIENAISIHIYDICCAMFSEIIFVSLSRTYDYLTGTLIPPFHQFTGYFLVSAHVPVYVCVRAK